MTTPNPTVNAVVEALEEAAKELIFCRDTHGEREAELVASQVIKALPLARSMQEKLERYEENERLRKNNEPI